MPRTYIRTHGVVSEHPRGEMAWEDSEIQELAKSFSVSREALLRRLLTLGLTVRPFYERKRHEYELEYANRPAAPGFVSPPQDALSLLGRPYVRLVLDNLEAGNITTSDASEYLGVRLKHLGALSSATEAE